MADDVSANALIFAGARDISSSSCSSLIEGYGTESGKDICVPTLAVLLALCKAADNPAVKATGNITVEHITEMFLLNIQLNLSRLRVPFRRTAEEAPPRLVAQLHTQLSDMLGDGSAAADALLDQPHLNPSMLLIRGATLETAPGILLEELQLLGTAAGAPEATHFKKQDGNAPSDPVAAAAAAAAAAPAHPGKRRASEADREDPSASVKRMRTEPPQLPGLNLPELPGPLPLWASKQPRLSSWLSRGEIALGHAAKGSSLPAESFWEQQGLYSVLSYMIKCAEGTINATNSAPHDSGSSSRSYSSSMAASAGSHGDDAAAARGGGGAGGSTQQGHQPVPASGLRPLQLFDWQVRAPYAALVTAIKDAATYHPDLLDWSDQRDPVLMLGKHHVPLPAKPIGRGAYGSVYAVDWAADMQLAVKVLDETIHAGDFASEVELLLTSTSNKMRHVLNFSGLGVVRKAGSEYSLVPAILTPLGSCSLQQLLSQLPAAEAGGLPWGQQHPQLLQEYMYQAALGVFELHHAGILHQDVKPANLILYQDPSGGGPGTVRIGDLGVATDMMAGVPVTRRGTPLYGAPEVLEEAWGSPGYPGDVWGWGATLLHMATGQRPWEHLSSTCTSAAEAAASSLKKLLKLHSDGTLACLECCPQLAWFKEQQPAGWEALVAALQWDPAARPTPAQLLAMPWFLQQRQAALEAADAQGAGGVDQAGGDAASAAGAGTSGSAVAREGGSANSTLQAAAPAAPSSPAHVAQDMQMQTKEEEKEGQQQEEEEKQPGQPSAAVEPTEADDYVPAYQVLLSEWRSRGRCTHSRWVGSCCACASG